MKLPVKPQIVIFTFLFICRSTLVSFIGFGRSISELFTEPGYLFLSSSTNTFGKKANKCFLFLSQNVRFSVKRGKQGSAVNISSAINLLNGFFSSFINRSWLDEIRAVDRVAGSNCHKWVMQKWEQKLLIIHEAIQR